jgi:hypothetical protein
MLFNNMSFRPELPNGNIAEKSKQYNNNRRDFSTIFSANPKSTAFKTVDFFER